jgi:hypothetical protein
MRSLFFSFIVLVPSLSFGLAFKQTALFRKCYLQMTREYLDKENVLFQKVLNGKITAAQGCLALLNEANLSANFLLKKTTPTSLSVLRTFQIFHSTWFPYYQIENLLKEKGGTFQIYDFNEVSYFFTIGLLRPELKYDFVLKSDFLFSAVRQGGIGTYSLDTTQDEDFVFLAARPYWTIGHYIIGKWKPKFVQVGSLLGFEINNRNTEIELQESKLHVKHKVVPGQGEGSGGPLSSASFLLLEGFLGFEKYANGATRSYRTWSKSILQNFLCRDLPVLSEEDVEQFVRPNSNVQFQKSKSCMICHSTMDPMGAVMRNAVVTKPSTENKSISTRSVHYFKPTEKKGEIEPLQNDEKYHLRPPDGILRFRSYNGDLIEKNITGNKQLAIEISKTDDFYICVAKRYFNFFTGIDVPIRNFKSEPPTDKVSAKIIDEVIKMGKELRKTQNLRSLIGEIFQSKYYQLPYEDAIKD